MWEGDGGVVTHWGSGGQLADGRASDDKIFSQQVEPQNKL